MNRKEVEVEVARIIDEQLDLGKDAWSIAKTVLDFLDSIGYDNQETI